MILRFDQYSPDQIWEFFIEHIENEYRGSKPNPYNQFLISSTIRKEDKNNRKSLSNFSRFITRNIMLIVDPPVIASLLRILSKPNRRLLWPNLPPIGIRYRSHSQHFLFSPVASSIVICFGRPGRRRHTMNTKDLLSYFQSHPASHLQGNPHGTATGATFLAADHELRRSVYFKIPNSA